MTKYGLATSVVTKKPGSTSVVTTSNILEGNFHPSITGHKLNGQNHLQWSQSVLMFIYSMDKEDYFTGDAAAPAKEDPKYKRWKAKNMVMSWLIDSMNNAIGRIFLLYTTAKVWDETKKVYLSNENTTKLFERESVLQDLHQGDLQVTQYFNLLTRYWQLLMYETHDWNCLTNGTNPERLLKREGSRSSYLV